MKKSGKVFKSLKGLTVDDFMILIGAAGLTAGLAITWPKAIPYFWGVGLLLLGIYRSG